MSRKAKKCDCKIDSAALSMRLERDAERIAERVDAIRDRVVATLRDALAPAPGVRVLLADHSVDYPTAVSWDIGHGNLIVNLAGGDIAAEFAHGEWRGVERMTSEETL